MGLSWGRKKLKASSPLALVHLLNDRLRGRMGSATATLATTTMFLLWLQALELALVVVVLLLLLQVELLHGQQVVTHPTEHPLPMIHDIVRH